jgi:hypothetical protein
MQVKYPVGQNGGQEAGGAIKYKGTGRTRKHSQVRVDAHSMGLKTKIGIHSSTLEVLSLTEAGMMYVFCAQRAATVTHEYTMACLHQQ